MRTLSYLESPSRRRIALETMEIYAPLAERMGMQRLKDELEDLAFAEINPEGRDSLRKRLRFLHDTEGDLIPVIACELRRTLADAGIDANVKGRAKQPFSIWRKMEKKHVSFEQIADVTAFRVLVADIGECYSALGAVHGAYPMIPGRFKDYISTPKPNDYRSLHTAVIGPRQRRVEVQIRTREMHDVAEFGVAAHWFYKQGGEAPPRDGRHYRWLRELKDIVEHVSNPEELLEHTKLEMYADQVFCFTRDGQNRAAARRRDAGGPRLCGAFGCRRHLRRGQGERPPRAVAHAAAQWRPGRDPALQRAGAGPQLGILRRDRQGEGAHPSLRSPERRKRIRNLGRSILEKAFGGHGRPFDDGVLAAVLDRIGFEKPAEACAAVGRGQLPADAVLTAVHPELKAGVEALRGRRPAAGKGAPVPIKGLTPGMAVHMAECCHPLSGDRIVGIITEGRGVNVHTIDCQVLESFSATPERWLDLSWDTDDAAPRLQVGRIVALMSNRPGSLNALTEAIARAEGNIVNLQNTNRSPDFFEFVVDIEVANVRQLTGIVAALRAHPAFFQVERERG